MTPCKCGKSSIMRHSGDVSFGSCSYHDCCTGPVCNTPEEAESAWNALMGEHEAVRKPVGMHCSDLGITVLCDDGSVFNINFRRDRKWIAIDPIPGTAADKKRRQNDTM